MKGSFDLAGMNSLLTISLNYENVVNASNCL